MHYVLYSKYDHLCRSIIEVPLSIVQGYIGVPLRHILRDLIKKCLSVLKLFLLFLMQYNQKIVSFIYDK